MKQFIHLNLLETAMNNILLSKAGEERKVAQLLMGDLINEIGSLIVNGESLYKKPPKINIEDEEQ